MQRQAQSLKNLKNPYTDPRDVIKDPEGRYKPKPSAEISQIQMPPVSTSYTESPEDVLNFNSRSMYRNVDPIGHRKLKEVRHRRA